MRRRSGIPLSDDPLWFKDAVIYELRVRSFVDSDGDGIGDLPGLTSKLDYLHDLGVTALWLLPLCPSPGRDDGYDIADYYDVHKDVGTLDDFRRFLDEAHKRGLRVITELVLNHTSDQHPWFQRARSAPKGSPERDFYVWSDTATRYAGARVIFKDFEHSNWTWDHVANQYFWHRFYSHQPDLNYENPAVHDAALAVCDFWYGLGVDGLRLDAVPYLYEAEGTNCENLPPTHAFLKKLRAHVDETFQGRMLLAEANQWPEDAAAYFGDGDECHMNFHFPIMPRMFMAIHSEDRFPILDILAQTPAIPASCQWAMFLRNHDELTLEMVTDDERDSMYRAYAADPVMRINLGIRRRLAPLCGNDRRVIELMNALLLTLPGTPVLYYGDEIGMGDNVYLGDRNGVRTPMQWSADRNAGFSRANPQRLILPVTIDPAYHYEAVNVEAQQDNPSSLLWWTKRALALRRRFQAFGRGTIEFLLPDNHAVLAFVRRYAHEGREETILVVANLSRHAAAVELPLQAFKGLVPVELSGAVSFAPIGDAPYTLTMGGRAFYWFSLEKPKHADVAARADAFVPPSLRAASFVRLLDDERSLLEDVLPAWLAGRPWLTALHRTPRAASIVDAVRIGDGAAQVHAVLCDVDFGEVGVDRYALPLGFVAGEAAGALRARAPHAVVVSLTTDDGAHGVVFEATADVETAPTLLDAALAPTGHRSSIGEVASTIERPTIAAPRDARLVKDARDSVIVFGDAVVLKALRRMDDGPSPELEVLRFLSARGDDSAPTLLSSLSYRRPRHDPITLALCTRYVPNEGDAAELARLDLSRTYERLVASTKPADPSPIPAGSFVDLAMQEPPALVGERIGPSLAAPPVMGRRIALLHQALASSTDPSFAPEPVSSLDKRSVYQTMRNTTGTLLRALRAQGPRPAPDAAAALLERQDEIYRRIRAVLELDVTSMRTRCHGDLHLAQLLFTGRDYVVTDFEGDRTQPVAHRRRKRSALRDVASMIVSFHRAAMLVLRDDAHVRPEDRARVAPWAQAWGAWCSAAFLRAYRETSTGAPFLPQNENELRVLLEAFVVERALWEVQRELDRRSAHVGPMLSLAAMLVTRA